MIIEPIEQDDDKPFVKITFTRKEAEILRELINFNIETYLNSYGNRLNIPNGSNETFAQPLHYKLAKLLDK